jgi:hypothetical protein
MNINVRLSYIPVLLLWLSLAIPFVFRTADSSYSHDFEDHLNVTRMVHQLKRIPKPLEGRETHQPPLYYLFASRMAVDSPHHVRCVRLFSVFLGAIVLLLLHATLLALKVKTLPNLLSLLFLATTPHFLFLFSTYNNDALAVFWAVFLLAMFLRYTREPSRDKALGMAAISILGGLSKYSFFAAAIAVAVIAFYLHRRQALKTRALQAFIGTQAIAAVLLVGWLYWQNIRTTSHWLPVTHSVASWQSLPHSVWRTILTPPGFSYWEWSTPFTDHFLPVGKKNSLLAYLFSSSIFGEHMFKQLADGWFWLIFWIHLAWLVPSLLSVRRDAINFSMAIAIGVAYISVAAYLFQYPYGSGMDFRMVAWLWLPLTVLRARCMEHYAGRSARRFAIGVLIVGILAQWTMIATL